MELVLSKMPDTNWDYYVHFDEYKKGQRAHLRQLHSAELKLNYVLQGFV